MNPSRKRFLACSAALSVSPFLIGMVRAQAVPYPVRPVRMVVPFPPGSGSDVAARVVGQHLAAALGQPFVVENKPGAGGSIGAMEVVRATPDGYTLFFGSSSTLAANVSLLRNMPYDPARDLSPIAGIADSVTALVVRSSFPAANLAQFVAHVRQRPGRLNASYGSSSTQIALAALTKVAGLEVTAVPYKGTPLAVQDLLAGNVDFTFADLGTIMPHVRAGTLRGLAITTPRRSSMVDWPSIASTYAAYEDITGWIALAGPAALPRDIAERLGAAVQQALQAPEVKSRLATFGLSPMPMSPAQLRTFIPAEVVKWERLARAANIEPE